MIKILLSAVFFCFLAVTVPISYGKRWFDDGFGKFKVGGMLR